jgi:hypothetical protein
MKATSRSRSGLGGATARRDSGGRSAEPEPERGGPAAARSARGVRRCAESGEPAAARGGRRSSRRRAGAARGQGTSLGQARSCTETRGDCAQRSEASRQVEPPLEAKKHGGAGEGAHRAPRSPTRPDAPTPMDRTSFAPRHQHPGGAGRGAGAPPAPQRHRQRTGGRQRSSRRWAAR